MNGAGDCFTWPSENPPILLVGPTATGKTAAAIALAEQIGGEIINADSMQVYRGVDIGTAKPTQEEQERVPFHLLDLVSLDQPFSVAEWKERAETALTDITHRGKQAIVCGGTGMYVRALMDNWTLADTPADPAIRAELVAEGEREGSQVLHRKLAEVDPTTAARLHPNDAVRIIRALEVYRASGTPISVYQERDRASRKTRPAFRFALDLPRPELYARIEARVDAMLAAGFEDEVRTLLNQGYAPTCSPLKSLGYKEIIDFICGALDYASAVALIKQNTRRFAKRQQTWFRAEPELTWLDVSALGSAEVAALILPALKARSSPTAIG